VVVHVSDVLSIMHMHVIPADMDSVNLDSEEWISVINNVTNVLKMWFRELPDPLTINIRLIPEPYGCR